MRYAPNPVPRQDLTSYLGVELRRMAEHYSNFFREDGDTIVEGSPDIEFRAGNGERFGKFTQDGSVEFDYNGSARFASDFSGMNVYGDESTPFYRIQIRKRDATELMHLAFNSGGGYIYSFAHGLPFQILGENSGGTAKTLAVFQPDGKSYFYYAGTNVLQVDNGSINVLAAYPVMSFYNAAGSTLQGHVGYPSSNSTMQMDNRFTDGAIAIRTNNSVSGVQTRMHIDGSAVGTTFYGSDGDYQYHLGSGEARLYSYSGSSPFLSFYADDDSTRYGFIQVATNTHLRSEVHGGNIFLENEDAGGTVRTNILLSTAASASSIGFHGSAAINKPTVTGSRGGNAALASLLTALANYGLITNSTT